MPLLVGDLDVSRETLNRLRHFESLVVKWSKAINLISRDSTGDIWTRHILDSAQLFTLIDAPSGRWADIGSGGGFPGVVSAILLAERAPDTALTMIESDQRKATFLRTALRECGVPGDVIATRIAEAPPAEATHLTARALAPVSDLLDAALRHLAPGGTAYFHKGRSVAEEVAAARESWSFDLTAHPSLTALDARIIEIRNIRRGQS